MSNQYKPELNIKPPETMESRDGQEPRSGFKELLDVAIGKTRSQSDFAKLAGISPEHLSRMLRHPEKYIPSQTTLRKIADASNGRVTVSMLFAACGYEDPGPVAEKSPENNAEETVLSLKRGLVWFSGKAMRYENIYDVLDTVGVLYGRPGIRYSVDNEKNFSGNGHSGAEKSANVTVEFSTDEYSCTFGFVMFYCITEKNGIIFSDCCFDLPTLIEFGHPVGMRKLGDIATRPNEVRSHYQTVYMIDTFTK